MKLWNVSAWHGEPTLDNFSSKKISSSPQTKPSIEESDLEPTLSIRVVGEKVFVATKWASGANLLNFAKMLVGLQTGEFIDTINQAIEIFGNKYGDNLVAAKMQEYIIGSFDLMCGDSDEPIVRPSEATDHLLGNVQRGN